LYKVDYYGDYKHRVPIEEKDAALRSGVPSIEAEAWYDRISAYGNRLLEANHNFAEAPVGRTSPEFFAMIGQRLIAGRYFTKDDRDAPTPPIVLNERVLPELFPRGENPLGAKVSVGDSSYVVVGVISRYSDLPDEPIGGWIYGESKGREAFGRIIRLKPGTSRAMVEEDLALVAQRIAGVAGIGIMESAFRLHRLAESQFHAQRFHYAFVIAVIAVLLVACANIANMQLARAITRRRELALRSALGASRARIVRLLLVESTLLAAAGLALGLVLTYWSAIGLRAAIPPAVGSYVVEPQLSWRVLAFAIAATVACVMLVGLAPAVQASRVDPNEMIKTGAGTGATRTNRQQYGVLVAGEIALALGLLSGAAIMVRGATRMSDAWFGFDPGPVVNGWTNVNMPLNAKMPESQALFETAQRIATVPGVEVAAVNFTHKVDNNAVTVSDSARGVREIPAPNYSVKSVSPSYLRAMGLPIVRGRDFREGERDEAGVIIDEFTAMRLWPNANPIGAQIKFGDMKSRRPFARIVGVVGYRQPNAKRFFETAVVNGVFLGAVYYLPGPQDTVASGRYSPLVQVTARGVDAPKLPIALRRAGVRNAVSLGERFRIERMSRAFVAKLFVAFALIGLCLAAVGVYGVVAHSVAERRRELGVRIALGANARDILRAVLRDSVVIALAGVALGLLATKYGVPLLQSFVFEDDLYNAPLFAGAALFLVTAAGIAAYVPALRATRVDPTESLRCE
jgi:putative ABC transport system permease protein